MTDASNRRPRRANPRGAAGWTDSMAVGQTSVSTDSRPDDLDARQIAVRVGDDEILVSWHSPATPTEGQAHGAEGICVAGTGHVVVISRDGRRWELPAGRPEGDETWDQTLRREVREEACATVVRARLLGFSRGEYVAG